MLAANMRDQHKMQLHKAGSVRKRATALGSL